MIRTALEKSLLMEMNLACTSPMRWGEDDCALWCGNVIRHAMDYDPCDSWRGKYADRDGALKVLAPLGLGFALRDAARKFGWVRIHPEEADVGDVGLATLGGAPTTMICRAPGWFVARNESGCTMVDKRVVRICWSVAP